MSDLFLWTGCGDGTSVFFGKDWYGKHSKLSAVLISSFTLWNFFLDWRSLLDVCDCSGFEHTLRKSLLMHLYEVKFLSLVSLPQSYELGP